MNDVFIIGTGFVHFGLQTHNSDIRVPDSAATATAMFAGEKVNYYTAGVNDKVTRGNCTNIKGNELKSILKHAIDAGIRFHTSSFNLPHVCH